jgi:GcrA cell cycle regulator
VDDEARPAEQIPRFPEQTDARDRDGGRQSTLAPGSGNGNASVPCPVAPRIAAAGAANRSNLGFVWTPKCEAWLRKLWNEHRLSASQIGSLLGITRNAVIGKARRLDLDRRNTANHKPRTPIADRRKRWRKRPTRPLIKVSSMPEAIPAPRPAVVNGQPVLLVDLRAEHCRWVLGDPKEMLFCGALKEDCSSYCVEHAKRAYQGGR